MLDDTVASDTATEDVAANTVPETTQEAPQDPPPPAGDGEKAEKYLKQLIELINKNKLSVHHTDLDKFDATSIEDHYRMDLENYDVEINHSKQPDTGQDFYVMLFNNIKKIEDQGESCINKVILAYTHLTQSQFEDFKDAAEASIERIRKAKEAKRFASQMNPIDKILTDLESKPEPIEIPTDEPEELSSVPEETNNQTEDNAPIEVSTDVNNSPKASDYFNQSATF